MIDVNEFINRYKDDIIFGSDISNNLELDEFIITFICLNYLKEKHISKSQFLINKKVKYKIIYDGKYRYYCPLCKHIVKHLEINHINEPLSVTIKNIIFENPTKNLLELFKILLNIEKESLIMYTCKNCNVK